MAKDIGRCDLRMTENEERIYRYMLDNGGWHSPTQIGNDVGGNGRHSAWASPICKRMVKKGLLDRNENGHYRAISLAEKIFQ